MLELFATCTPGLETYTLAELEKSELTGLRPIDGGINFSGDLETVYRLNLKLRTANRILIRLGKFYAAAFSELRKKASRLAWERYLSPGQPVAIRVTCRKSRLYHSDAVAERVLGAIGDHLGQTPPLGIIDNGKDQQSAQLVIVRLWRDRCTISIDTSGELLHRRGYRLGTAKAPLRETLAAGIILASGWDMKSPLIDPFCGSGTIAIEAALMVCGIAPGKIRRFAFMDWPDFDDALWNRTLSKYKNPHNLQIPVIQASDRDAGAIEIAQANAERAGVADNIIFSCRAISAIAPGPEAGWVVTNPPYGRRASADKDLRNLYAQIGNVLQAKCAGWRVAILCSNLQLLGHTKLRLDTSLMLDNGGITVRLGRGEVI